MLFCQQAAISCIKQHYLSTMYYMMATSQSHTAGHLTTALTTPLLCGCVQAVAGRHCLMIDDLCDSGLTLMSVRDRLLEAGAASVKSVVLLDKRARRKVGGGGQDKVAGSQVVGTARGGFTLLSVRDRLLEAGSASVKSVVLLDKTALRKVRGRLGAAEQQIV